MNRWTSLNLHEELAGYYGQFRGTTAPSNSFTESLWRKIEEVEYEEQLARAASR
jgi:hypothetical protein